MSQSVFTIAIKHKKVFFDYELLFFRNWRYEQELASLIWKIDPKEIQKKPETAYSAISIMSNNGVGIEQPLLLSCSRYNHMLH